jgi:hypothetical protein
MPDLLATSREIAGACINSKDISEGLHDKMRDNMRIPDGLLFIWGVVPSVKF